MATKYVTTVIAALLLTGCASTDEIVQKRAEYRESYFLAKAECEYNGGHLTVKGNHLYRDTDAPEFGSVYYCSR